MALPIKFNTSGSGTNSGIIYVNFHVAPSNIGVHTKVSGTVNFSIYRTQDYPWDAATRVPLSASQFDWIDVVSATTGDTFNSLANLPTTAIYIVQNSGSGNVRGTILQAGIAGR